MFRRRSCRSSPSTRRANEGTEFARLSPGQRQALDREYEAIYQRLGRPVRASTIAILLTAQRRADATGAKGRQ